MKMIQMGDINENEIKSQRESIVKSIINQRNLRAIEGMIWA